LFELGLGAYLVEKHYPKYGRTYYFKPDIDNPADRTYVVDEIPTAPQILSFQINRFTFDREVRDRNVESGVELIDGTVTGVNINSNDGRCSTLLGRERALACRCERPEPGAREPATPPASGQGTEKCFLVPADEFLKF
jgi:flavin-dependent dehydrogenase